MKRAASDRPCTATHGPAPEGFVYQAEFDYLAKKTHLLHIWLKGSVTPVMLQGLGEEPDYPVTEEPSYVNMQPFLELIYLEAAARSSLLRHEEMLARGNARGAALSLELHLHFCRYIHEALHGPHNGLRVAPALQAQGQRGVVLQGGEGVQGVGVGAAGPLDALQVGGKLGL